MLIVAENDKLVAFVSEFPSLSRAVKRARGRLLPFGWIYIIRALKKNRYIDLLLVAVRPDLQGKGVNALLMTEFRKAVIENKVISAGKSRELEDNRVIQAHWDYQDSRQHKRRRCYIKHLD